MVSIPHSSGHCLLCKHNWPSMNSRNKVVPTLHRRAQDPWAEHLQQLEEQIAWELYL
jgi:hypothetical protein